MGLFKRALSFQGASRSDGFGGLLKRSLQLLDELAAAPVETAEALRGPSQSGQAGQSPVADPYAELLACLNEIEEGIETPGGVFSLLVERLKPAKAALLLYDPVRMVFAPWAVNGFDKTTSHRLRIPPGANDTMNRLAAGKVFLLSDKQQLQPFQQYFSLREFANLANLLILPFAHESKFMGLLFMTATRGSQINLEALQTLAARAAVLFYRARERHLEGAKRGVPEQPQSLRDSVREAIQPCVQKGVSPLMIRINIAKLLRSIKKRYPHIDSFRMSQDLSRIVYSLFQSLGTVFQIDRDRILILVTRSPEAISAKDSGLLLYHLSATLGRLLPALTDGKIDLDEQVRIPPPDIEEALTLLAEIA